MSDSKQTTWAVRSADANHLDFASLPLIGLIGVARTAAEGAAKYGRFNYMLGVPVHNLLNHVIRPVVALPVASAPTVVPGFAIHDQARREIPPKQVRHPTD